jgi:hypothetical protein
VTEGRFTGDTCAAVQAQLADFAAHRLDPIATGVVRVHLSACRECNNRVADLLLADMSTGELPTSPGRPLPPMAGVLGPRKTTPRFGTIWNYLRTALGSSDADLGRWAHTRVEEINRALGELLPQMPPAGQTSPLRARGSGALRARGAVRASSLEADALVVGGDDEPRGRADLVVDVAPAFRADSTFVTRVHTNDARYDGAGIICTLRLPGTTPLSFGGLMEAAPDEAYVGSIEARNVPWKALEIPLRDVSYTIVVP